MNEQRRKLQFADLDQVAADAEKLLADGYVPTGKWNLAQVCAHLNDWMQYPIDGYPRAALPIRAMLWLMKVTIGKRQLNSVLKQGFRDSLPTMPATVHAADSSSDQAAVEQLVATIDRFKRHSGEFHSSPIYGELTADEHFNLQLAHCAHHLSFLVPHS